MIKKKNYCPLGMWGSYVGGILGYLIIIIVMAIITVENRPNFDFMSICIMVITPALLGAFLGFLAGWGVHSLVRRLRK